MRFSNVDCIGTKGINDLEVMLEHIRVLIIFGVDILPYCRGERQLSRLAKREVEKVSNTLTVSSSSRVSQWRLKLLTSTWLRLRTSITSFRAVFRLWLFANFGFTGLLEMTSSKLTGPPRWRGNDAGVA
jgi:hypothetical protein